MKTILVGECSPDHIFTPIDPNPATEADFELHVCKALTCVYASYTCVMFGGTFRLGLDGDGSRPDLALVARDLSHWFVIEVELVSHSFQGHVLPQVRSFTYGEPQGDCQTILARELGLSLGEATTLVRHVPRSVAVVANRWDQEWETGLRALGAQLLTVTAFGSPGGVTAYQIDGSLVATEESLGFGQYSATDRSVRFPRNVRLLDGEVEIDGPSGERAIWIVARTVEAAWVAKRTGRPDIRHGVYVMLARTYQGRLILRVP